MNSTNYKYTLCYLILIFHLGIGPVNAIERQISVYVPPFEGPIGLSNSVSTILRLQIWQTLRKTDHINSPEISFGDGVVKWGPHHLPQLSHRSAETMAHHGRILSQVVLWGTVQEYGGGAIVQAYLSIPLYERINDQYYADMRNKNKEVWTVSIPVDQTEFVFVHDIPRRRLYFEPIVLTKQVIENYSALNSIALYDPQNTNQRIGTVGNSLEALVQHGDKALVTSQGVTGVVKLPELSASRSEVVDFVSGLMGIFRGDWKRALHYFAQVVDNPNTPTEVRIDAYLYRAMANNQLGRSGTKDIRRARELNPYTLRIIRFGIMDKLSGLKRALKNADSDSHLGYKVKAIVDFTKQHQSDFLPGDPWLRQLKTGLKHIQMALHDKGIQ